MNPRGIFSIPTTATRRYAPLASAPRAASTAAPPEEQAFSTFRIGMPVCPSSAGDPVAGAGLGVHVRAHEQVDVAPAHLGVGQRLDQRLGAHDDRRLVLEAPERVHADALGDERVHAAPPETRYANDSTRSSSAPSSSSSNAHRAPTAIASRSSASRVVVTRSPSGSSTTPYAYGASPT